MTSNATTRRLRCIVSLIGLTLLTAAFAAAADKGHTVDSGTFAILVNGQRVATETFHIQQGTGVNVASSEFKAESGNAKSSQKAELQISANGDLRRYEWHELSPGKAQVVVEWQDTYLMEHVTPNQPDTPVHQPFMVPASTMVLDDYVFSQREILAWRYLAQACGGNLTQCQPGRTQFGVLVPQQRSSIVVTMEYAGPEKVNLRGKEEDLNRINMKVDDVDWVLYMDAGLKLVRILVPSEHTEVVRQ